MKRIFLSLIIIALAFSACDKKESKTDSAAKQEVANAEAKSAFLGESFNEEEEINLNMLVSKMDSSDSLEAVVEAKVTEVCQSKGCWMKVELPNGESMRVTFKDYGFFIPKDLAGASVTMSGMAKKEETDVETLRHFAEDAGKSEEEVAQITEAKLDYKFVASGVKLGE